MLQNCEKQLHCQICSNLKEMKGFLLCETVNLCWLWIDKTKHHVHSPKRSSYYLSSADSWQLSEIKYPGTRGIVSLLFCFSRTIGRENQASKWPKDIIKNESRESSCNLLSRNHAMTVTLNVGAVLLFSQQANWLTLFIWSYSWVCSQSPLITIHLWMSTGNLLEEACAQWKWDVGKPM